MRRIRARGAIGIGLALVLVVGAVGGWMFFRSDSDGQGQIVVGTTSTPSMLDPGGAFDAGASMLTSNLYQSLLTYAPGEEQPVPDAAEECVFTDNQLTVYRCELRGGLTFSNGREITPEDVKFSFDRILAMTERAAQEDADDSIPEDEKFTYAGPSSLLATLDAVRVDGRDVIFELSKPDATFPFVVASSAGAIVDREKYEELEPRADNEVDGSGPYLLTGFEADQYAELEPNPDYDGAAEVPEHSIRVEYFTETEDASAEELLADAWESGEIDVNDGKMPPDVMADLSASDPEYRFTESTGTSIRTLGFNTRGGAPMADEQLRQAAAALLDREAITRRVQHDTVEALYSLIPVGFTGHGTPYYDRYMDTEADGLRADLEAAGHELPVPFELAYSRGAANHAEAELIERQLEADGIFDVEITYYPWAEFLPAIYGQHPFDAYLIGWRADYPDPSTFTDQLVGQADGLNTGFSSDSVNRLIEATQAEPDRGRAAEDFRTIHEQASEAASLIPIWQDKRITISTTEISGIQNLSSNSGVWRLWELRRI
ncbi:ABC transporter substrate-binding protein [Streptomyces johnsoniae]|uniref:ABC transporter substrate-binding protein n=1 Tax=Streptomyces johnsoniae TaxID=3075532 RepID=A0ABU2S3Z1_9ACTN|nr:ABC transporter substrate-binding protein [Streptomyces sp. DSM 41886]MDT0443682.1 ABC transporter substrate-binding protein [Streptomyces sp. DSM 41886]